jgi:hypothetical protein
MKSRSLGARAMAQITEQSEHIVTVVSDRKEEFTINQDEAALALTKLFSDYDNEKRFGWELKVPWYEDQLKRLRKLCVIKLKGK